MDRTDLTAAVAERLRSKGVAFQPADLDAFVGHLPPKLEGDADVEALTKHFAQRMRRHAWNAAGRRWGWITFVGGLLLAITGWAGLAILSATRPNRTGVAPPDLPGDLRDQLHDVCHNAVVVGFMALTAGVLVILFYVVRKRLQRE
ncbi:MAG TPA: hypothetical protein VMS17_29510 [Gemmataceae bacterium]|nr:hypothetical protein [Gemmataceae bacterium]